MLYVSTANNTGRLTQYGISGRTLELVLVLNVGERSYPQGHHLYPINQLSDVMPISLCCVYPIRDCFSLPPLRHVDQRFVFASVRCSVGVT
jgi:hypothetical protein